jgi:hypothetical protein
VKFKALGRTGAKWALTSYLAAFASLLPLGAAVQDVIAWATLSVLLAACGALAVWAALNVPAGARALLGAEKRTVPEPPQGMMVIGMDERRRAVYVAVPGSSALTVQRAIARGTFSVNGYRYLGPPPVTTGPQPLPGGYVWCDWCHAGTVWCHLDHARVKTVPAHAHRCGECAMQ